VIRALYDTDPVKPQVAATNGLQIMSDELDIAVLTATFDALAGAEAALSATLARYVVLTRHVPACRNVDLVASITRPGRLLLIEKWDSADAVQAHLDSPLMADMASEALPTLASKPEIDLYDTISAHDLT
jgi:quinol monooxygenase YgiN